MKKVIIVIVIIVIAIALIGGYFLFKGNTQFPVSNDVQQLNKSQQTNTVVEPNLIQSENNYEVIYTNSGYSPRELIVKVGDTVTWKNENSQGMWTASGMHPTHVIYSGTSLDEHCPDTQNTSFDECKSAQPGESWSFKFDKKGTWRYHNHVQPSDFGTVVVE